ncbi:MAG: glycerate kinase [Gemmatimonadales bacterium]
MTPAGPSDASLLRSLYDAAVAAVNPGPATESALEQHASSGTRPLFILALGKAAAPMADAATRFARRTGRHIAGGLVVAPDQSAAPDAAVTAARGDHPEPGPASFAAAELLGQLAARVGAGDDVWVLLSGGTTSLIGAPRDGFAHAELKEVYARLLASGLDIADMNRIRKRFTRWGGGKLAAALAPARVLQLVVSDVIGDDLASIGSGPCVPDPMTAADTRALLQRSGLWTTLPTSIRTVVEATEAGTLPETPKPGDAVFANVTTSIISSNRLALEAIARRAAELGLASEMVSEPLAGEARTAGASVAATLRNYSQARQTQDRTRRCVIWGGETTVTLGEDPGLGGRCQELALSAAQTLAGGDGVTLLAGGTDGRDGPTDAAGAIVDGQTWDAIEAAGRDPASDLDRHDAYHALAAAGVLLQPGLTGTNVMDVVIGVA